ncbi:hypothetical protein CFAM422_007822 [Trichoderma lentiforme]|uniref:Uncharacterized protein n=1 Tax=Trichoderma lentiforme TaxID=1567552 RepID=A0A9P4XCP8_9HYPO|nr:hypothetical protein CFAM422_007822 [Trichoderma lentiforme]
MTIKMLLRCLILSLLKLNLINFVISWRIKKVFLLEMMEEPGARGPAPDLVNPSWSLLDQLSVPSKATYLRQIWASLGLLYDQGVTIPDGMSLTLDQRGMPILVGGLAMTEERLRQTLSHYHPQKRRRGPAADPRCEGF